MSARPGCLRCGSIDVWAVEDADGTQRQPGPGDPVMCAGCGEVMTVDARGGALTGFTEEQIAALCARLQLDPAKARRRAPANCGHV